MNQHAIEATFARLGYRRAIHSTTYLRFSTDDGCPTGVSISVSATLDGDRWAFAACVASDRDMEPIHEGYRYPENEQELEFMLAQLGARSHEHRLARMAERMAT